jgi:hypothetical protein
MPSVPLHAHPQVGTRPLVSEPPIDPLAPADQLAHWLAGAAEHVLIGLVLGLLAAPLMRRHRLHWSCAAAAFALVVITRGALGALAPTLAGAAFTAAWRGRRWHREDLEAGADLGEAARQRLTPVDALRWVLRELPGADADARDRIGHAGMRPSAEPVLGEDANSRCVTIPLQDSGGGLHTLVVGATGSGKTVTETAIALAAIERGMAIVVVDPKGDRSMRSTLARAAHAAGAPFLEWTPTGPTVYNPFAHGAPTEIADRARAGERFTEPHYLRQAQRYLGHEVRILRAAARPLSLAELVLHLDPQRLEALARTLPEGQDATHDYLQALTARQLSDLAGVRDRLAVMVESDVGPWLDPRTPGALAFELPCALRERAVVYFRLHADERPLLAQMLGAAIVQDLQSAVAGLQEDPVPSLVVIDEFSALAAEHVWRLFARARSAGMSLLLATQELSDLRVAGNERLQEQILGNLSTLIAHRQVVPASAELIARLAGTRGAWKTSLSSSGHRTRTRVREHLLAPERISRLPRGHAAVLALGGAGSVTVARVYPPSQ